MKRGNIIVNLTSILFVLLCNSCGYGDCGDNNHYRTDTLSNSIYVEEYRCFCGGATTTDVFYVYLTDSISFRKYVGINDFPYEKAKELQPFGFFALFIKCCIQENDFAVRIILVFLPFENR